VARTLRVFLPDAIVRFGRRLTKHGPFIFDSKDETKRNNAIRLCIEASIEDLDEADTTRFCDLAALPVNEDVPIGMIEQLWETTVDFDRDDADDLHRREMG
jgi:hypothetical protein